MSAMPAATQYQTADGPRVGPPGGGAGGAVRTGAVRAAGIIASSPGRGHIATRCHHASCGVPERRGRDESPRSLRSCGCLACPTDRDGIPRTESRTRAPVGDVNSLRKLY
jgi:hypothetical protein